jgi:hypothetical protein
VVIPGDFRFITLPNVNVTHFQPGAGIKRSQHPEPDSLSTDFEIESQKVGCWLCTRYND